MSTQRFDIRHAPAPRESFRYSGIFPSNISTCLHNAFSCLPLFSSFTASKYPLNTNFASAKSICVS